MATEQQAKGRVANAPDDATAKKALVVLPSQPAAVTSGCCCISHYWAVVERDGTLVRGHNVWRTARVGQGQYEVVFTGDVSAGVYVMLEFVWVANDVEAQSPPVDRLGLWPRWQLRGSGACPFGICFRPAIDAQQPPPFETWTYRPEYSPIGIEIGVSSDRAVEPLLRYRYRSRSRTRHFF
jgi:hypothetical protein